MDIPALIAMGPIPFNCALDLFEDFDIRLEAFATYCPNGTTFFPLESFSITFIVRCEADEYDNDCSDPFPNGPNGPAYGSTGPVTISFSDGIQMSNFQNPQIISLEDCGCNPVAL